MKIGYNVFGITVLIYFVGVLCLLIFLIIVLYWERWFYLDDHAQCANSDSVHDYIRCDPSRHSIERCICTVWLMYVC